MDMVVVSAVMELHWNKMTGGTKSVQQNKALE